MVTLYKKIVAVLLVCFYSVNCFSQTNINRVEYYIDADPGYGNATAAAVTASPNVNTSFNVNVASLLPGLHVIGVRSKDANGAWSFDERWLVLKQSPAAALVNITKAEWYIDKDPGYDKAFIFPSFTPGSTITNLSFNHNRLDTLSAGLHVIGVRSKDANGTWSFDERWLVLKQSPAAPLVNITAAEWYLDKDPGYGKAKRIDVVASTDLVNLSFTHDQLDTITQGLHVIGVRSKDANGAWSFDERWLLLKQAPADTLSAITKAEWYIDKDPGYGRATDLNAATPGNMIINYTRLDTLTPGLHVIGVRSQNANGTWSFDERWLILKQSPAVVAPKLQRIEYYIDADPGKGNAVPLAFQPEAKEVAALPSYINVTGLAAGKHTVAIRSRDANGAWSFDDTLSFTIATPKPAPYININSVAFTNVCSAGAFSLGFHATGVFNTGNEFIAELSDSSGNFTTATKIGSIQSTASNLINCVMPANAQQGTGFKIRVKSTNPPLTGNGSDQNLSIVSVDRFFLGADTFAVALCAESTLDLNKYYNPQNSTLTWSVANPTAAPIGVHTVYATNAIGCRDTAVITITLNINTWLGTTSTNWHTATNWSAGKIPTDSTHVIIPSNAARICEISAANAIAASVQVRNGATLLVLPGRRLDLITDCKTLPK